MNLDEYGNNHPRMRLDPPSIVSQRLKNIFLSSFLTVGLFHCVHSLKSVASAKMTIKRYLRNFFQSRTNHELVGAIDLNDVLDRIGYWGKFHNIQIALLFLICLPAGITFTQFVFTGFLPAHRCVIPQCEKAEKATYYDREITPSSSWSSGLLKSEYAEKAAVGKCERITFDDDREPCDSFMDKLKSNDSKVGDNRKTVQCQEDIVFDSKYVESSFSIYYGFYCSNFYLKGIFSSLALLGMLIGSFVSGFLSDKFGRKKTIVIFILVLPITGIICAFRPPVAVFAICQLLLGMSSIGAFLCSSVMIAESTLSRSVFQRLRMTQWTTIYLKAFFLHSMRLRCTRTLSLVFAIGGLYNALFSYGLRNEFQLQLALYCPMFLLVIPCYFVLESTRWLISKGRIEEAKEQIKYMARINGVEAPESFSSQENSDREKEESVAELFKPKKMLLRTLLLFSQWFSVMAMSAKLNFGFTALIGNPYGNFAIGSAIQIPASLISMYLIDRLGRRFSGAFFMIIAGILTVATGFVTNRKVAGNAQIILAGIGRGCTTIVWGSVYLHAIEMYPTRSRAMAIGLSSTIARFGGVFALGIGGLEQVWSGLTFLVIGIISIAIGIAGFLLPETTGEKLPETKEEALKIGENYKLVPWCRCKAKVRY